MGKTKKRVERRAIFTRKKPLKNNPTGPKGIFGGKPFWGPGKK
jgi:hypothetical protein